MMEKHDKSLRAMQINTEINHNKCNRETYVAVSALAKAMQTKLKNEELKNAAELRKRKAEIAPANVCRLLEISHFLKFDG